MAVVDPDTGGGNLGTGEAEADVTFRDGEPIVWEFIPGQPEQGTRQTYTADESGVTFGLVLSTEAAKSPTNVLTVARQYAAMWNANAAVAGVEDISETTDSKPLGGLQEVAQVAVASTSGRNVEVVTLTQDQFRSDVFADVIKAERARLDAFEA